jgi:hypothetical protein
MGAAWARRARSSARRREDRDWRRSDDGDDSDWLLLSFLPPKPRFGPDVLMVVVKLLWW